jgi:acyl transferase domain-containing protein/NAD(P)H-dependent flavin oxidoreductase YrpB (nitropropane dioxygenase family)/NAD(P)-dependent dehydrogenase (short-subunit alcohol dehydrogenase family)
LTDSSLLCLTPFERPDVGLCAALARTSAFAILDLGHDRDQARLAVDALENRGCQFGVRFSETDWLNRFALPETCTTVVLPAPGWEASAACRHCDVLVQVTSLDEARAAQANGAKGIIAKGSESGGSVGDPTAFLLCQQLVGKIDLPLWIQGGIGRHTAAACLAAGARGVVLDSQLACLRESSLGEDVKAALARLDGSETRVVGGYRVCIPPGAGDALRDLTPAPLAERLGPKTGETFVVAGQDVSLASSLAETFPTANRLVRGLQEAMSAHLGQARTLTPMAPGAKLAETLGTTYPIVQGPMSRVSDQADFALAVADAGAMPTLALAMLDANHVERMLTETATLLEGKPWGVGILGFAPPELHAAQKRAIVETRPSLVIIAGGRPNQAREFEDLSIPTFLHVPSTGLLDLFLQDGARRFIFEGHECGGHIGPRSSFALWEEQVEQLLNFESPEDLSILFAGGIHDALSAAMVSAIAAPLAAVGAEVGVIMGSAYLFTREAVSTGAILPGFQKAVLACVRTAVLETGPGHVTRCAESAFVETFEQRKSTLAKDGTSTEEAWLTLERLNLGRLRIASKGEHQQSGDEDDFTLVGAEGQRADGLFMAGQLAALRDRVCDLEELHRDVCVNASVVLEKMHIPDGDAHQPTMGEIAIVGMACLYPDAPDLESYWANILAGTDCVREVPRERWNPDIYFDPSAGPDQRGQKSVSKWGGFLPRIDFDPISHGTPPNALPAIEPVQLLALEVARRALADAGYEEREFDRSRASVIFGAETGCDLSGAYTFRSLYPMYVGGEMPPELDHALPHVTEDTFPGIIVNVIAGRVANRLDLGGVNYTVDAACASSLASVYSACQELLSGNSDLVLSGGADLHNSINDYLMFSSVQVLSPQGKCRTFAADADGIVLGEGVAVLVLKRLADAQRDGDRIYATIKGIAGTSDGKAVGLTVPRREGQTRVLKDAYARAGVSPRDIGLVEAHGTGTVLGDRIELGALTDIYTAAGVKPASCALGSVKSQIGHTKCAAGLAGIIKVALALHTRTLPPTLQIKQPNPAFDPRRSPFALNATVRPWSQAQGVDRVGAVSAFGFGGSNFHAVLGEHRSQSEYRSQSETRVRSQWPAELLLLRAELPDQATALAAKLESVLAANPRLRLRDVAHTLALHATGPTQVAIVATDGNDLQRKLAAVREGVEAQDVYRAGDSIAGKIAFLCPGQGSQRVGMLADLFAIFPQLEPLLDLGPGLRSTLYPPTPYRPQERAAQVAAINDTSRAQPLMGIADLALSDLLAEVGIWPDMLAGHSYGELPALCIAGALDRTHLVDLSTARAEAILNAAGDRAGTMAAVRASAVELRPVVEELGGLVVMANHNAPDQTVLSGPVEDIAHAREVLAAKGFDVREIPVSCAFHSPLIAPGTSAFRKSLKGVAMAEPALPVYSNTTAEPYPRQPEAIRARLAQHLASPIRFVEEIRAMYDAGARIFVEVGPGRVLTGLVQSILREEPHLAVATNETGQPSLPTLLGCLAQLAVHGAEPITAPLYANRDTTPFDLEAPPTRPPGTWEIDGHRATPAVGPLPDFAMHPITDPIPASAFKGRAAGATSAREAVVVEFLQSMRDMVKTQREVMLTYLGATPSVVNSASAPADAESASNAGETANAEETVDIQAVLLEQVSDRTGYPVEMLDLDLDLAADLSIDSIKRVEILGVLSRKIGLARGDLSQREKLVEKLTACKTLRAILETLEEVQGGSEPEAASETKPESMTPGDSAPALVTAIVPDTVQRFELKVSATPAATADPELVSGRTFGVTQDGSGVAEALCGLLKDHGAQPRILAAGEPVGQVDGLILLDGLGTDWKTDAVPDLFPLVRDSLVGGAKTLVAATALGGRFGGGDKYNGAPHRGGVSGLVKSVAKEWPQVRVRVVDFDPAAEPNAVAAAVRDEMLAQDDLLEIGYDNGVRHTVVPVAAQCIQPADAALALDPDSVVLLTGGARGITGRVARELAARYRTRLILVGRSPQPTDDHDPPDLAEAQDLLGLRKGLAARGEGLSPADIDSRARRILSAREMRSTLAALRQAGAEVEYHSVDVRDRQAFGALLDSVYERFGRLDGVIHGAGLIEDRLLVDKTLDSFRRVFDTKVAGATIIDQKIRKDVRFVVFFSSVSGVFGNRGQIDYAAANDALDKLAATLNHRIQGRALSINWGPWAATDTDSGMVSAALEAEYARQGIGMIPSAEGVASLLDELTCDSTASQVILMRANPEPFLTRAPAPDVKPEPGPDDGSAGASAGEH